MLKNRNLVKFGIIIAAIALIAIVGVVVAQSVKHEEEIIGTATVTVNTGGSGGGGGGDPICQESDPVYNFTPSPSSVDFSGSVYSGAQYVATRTIEITNDGSTGVLTDCTIVPAPISDIMTSASGMADGWGLTSGNLTGFPLGVGETGSIDLILTGPDNQTEQADLYFTITLSAT